MAFTLQDFTFNQRPSIYNASHQTKLGGISWYGRNDKYQWSRGEDNKGFMEYHVDLTNASSSDQAEVQLFRFANGVNVKGFMYPSTIGEDNISAWIRVLYYDKDGNQLNYNESFMIECPTRYGSLSDFVFFFNPCNLKYDLTESQHPNQYCPEVFYYYRNTASPYDPMDINSAYDTNNRFTYYGRTEHALTEEELARYWDMIIRGGDGTPISPIRPSEDTSTTGGGDDDNPDYNPFSDPIPFPDLPLVGALSTGLITAYNPGYSTLRLLGEKLWSADFVNEIRKIQNDPMEAVISLHLLPFEVYAGASAECMIGNYNTHLTMPVISTQFVSVNGGEIDVNERFASALDYSPYTTAYIHIPFVGIVPMDIDYIMKKHLSLKYQVDVLTGGATALLMCDNAILYSFPCEMAMTVPLSSSNHRELYQSGIQTAMSLGHLAVASGAVGGDVSPMRVGHSAVNALGSALNTVASKHSEVQKSGAITGVQGMLDSFETYLIFHRPIQSLAQRFAHFKGFPCNITYTLSSLSGYTEVEYAHLEGVTATDEEKEEIQTLLQAGVIL